MKATLKIRGLLLDEIRRDLARPHAFAHERVGFLTAGAATTPDGILMLVRGYRPVQDDDYEEDPRVGGEDRIERDAQGGAVGISPGRGAASYPHPWRARSPAIQRGRPPKRRRVRAGLL